MRSRTGLPLVIFVVLFAVFGLEPSFDVPVINVTVQESDVAILPCSVDYLGDHKVVWTDQWSTLLTLDDRRIIDDPRISIERPYTRDWNLHIRKVTYNDRGQYTCQINTNPVKTKTVMLNVLVTLVCNVTGVPTPEVTWYKLPNEGLHSSKERLDLEPGLFTNIDSCAYTLQQTDYILPDSSDARNIIGYGFLELDVPPEVNLPTKRIGQYAGRETILDCEITAYPHGPDDFGEYICFALNTIGQDRETMLLYEQIPKKTSKTPDDTEIRRQGNDDWTDGNGFLTSVTRGPNIPGGGSRHPNRPYQPVSMKFRSNVIKMTCVKLHGAKTLVS
ncbi:LSAMP-like protein [Mya arenaria]|uniref:LSAMP-like protein n=1 Tax=Mya arenaria TaxID=6604 RepID=A0ABY7DQ83_MYAAR|nr:LSAMP-like protein [Mya arenaria]